MTEKWVSEVTIKTVNRPYPFSRYVCVAICAIPGPFVANLPIETKTLSHKPSGALFLILAGTFMLISGASRSRDATLALECILAFSQYALIAVFMICTTEVFHPPARGVALGDTRFAWRLFGLVAWVIIAYSNDASGAGFWFSGALMAAVNLAWLLLPAEASGKAAA